MKLLLIILLSALSLLAQLQVGSDQVLLDDAPQFVPLFSSAGNAEAGCYRIPAIVTAPNGDVIVAVDERVPSCGDLKWNPDINIVMRRSTDNGLSWSTTEAVVDLPAGKSASDPSMIVDRTTGTIFLFFNYMDLEREKGAYYFYVMQSTDNGQTWSEPADITAQVAKPEWHRDFKFITSGNGIQIRSGKLIHTMVNLQHGLHLFGSDDHGESWHLLDVPIELGDESKVVELADGRWMVNSRVNGKGLRYVHLSGDEGKTWISYADSALVDPGCNAGLLRYSSGDEGSDQDILLFSNAKDPAERKNMTVRISYDEGRTWSHGRTIYAGSSAYSSMTILANGDIGLVFEKDDYSEIVFVSLKLDWLM